ncbi:MAG: MarR family transcriptional regulator [Bacteroidales bacterium]|nr:MarR family transcriptional regulator [Bacteroidales bacterium]
MYEGLRLDSQLCFRLYSLSRLLTQRYHSLLEPLGLTYPQYLVMMVLWERDNVSVSYIAQRLMLDTNTLTPILQRMERKGLVVRTIGKADGRQRIVSLTKIGNGLEKQASDVPRCMAEQLLSAGLDQAEAIGLVQSLDKLIGVLREE